MGHPKVWEEDSIREWFELEGTLEDQLIPTLPHQSLQDHRGMFDPTFAENKGKGGI